MKIGTINEEGYFTLRGVLCMKRGTLQEERYFT